MTIQTSGPISLTDIVAEFGGNVPYALSSYYRGGGRVPDGPTANNNIPTSGPIAFSNFYGATNIIAIPTVGTITQHFGLSYSYGNPTVLSWTRSGNVLTYNITSYTTYCGSAKSTSGTATITTTNSGGVIVETASWTFAHGKDCCNGNQNYIWEYYTLTMSGSNTAVLSASSSSGGQSGC